MDSATASNPSPDVTLELPGWTLAWVPFSRTGSTSSATSNQHSLDQSTTDTPLLDQQAQEVVEQVQERYATKALTDEPTIAAARRLLRQAGCDPTRYRSSPEALLRRLVKGQPLPRIHPLVDVGNLLSARLAVPCCMLDAAKLTAPFVLRKGRDGERYESLRGDFNLAGKPLLADAEGPCDTPITGSRRAGVTQGTERAWFVAYLPSGVVQSERVETELRALSSALPAWRLGPMTVVGEA